MWIPGRENLDTYTRNFLRDPQGRLRCALSAMRNAVALPVGSCGESFLRYACSGCSLYEDYEERKNKPSRTAKGDEPHGGSFGLSRRGIFFIVRNQLKILFLSALRRKQKGLIDRICGAWYAIYSKCWRKTEIHSPRFITAFILRERLYCLRRDINKTRVFIRQWYYYRTSVSHTVRFFIVKVINYLADVC